MDGNFVRFALWLSIFAFWESGNKEVEWRERRQGWPKPVSPEKPPSLLGQDRHQLSADPG